MLRMQKCGYLLRSVVLLFFVISYSTSESITNGTTTLAPVSPCVVENNIAVCSDIENFDSLTDVTISKLVVRSQKLKSIQANDLAKFVDLKTIDISDSGLTEIDPEAFGTLTNLEEINLSGNTELKIPEAFIHSKTLTHLNLSEVPIGHSTEKIFNEVPNLKVLDLTATNIQDLTPISNLKTLATLVISKDDSYNTTTICDHKSLKTILIKTEDGQEEQIICEEKTIVKNVDVKIGETKEMKAEEIKNPEEINEMKTEEITTVVSDHNATHATESPTLATSEKINEENDDKISEVAPTTAIAEKRQEAPTTETTTPCHEEHHHPEEAPAAPKIDPTSTEKPIPLVRKVEVPPPADTIGDKDEVIPDVGKNQENHDSASEDEGKNDLASTIETADSNGTNIVLGIVLCVMVVGALGFGYKYYKNRRSGYRHANTSENVEEGKELQTIVAHHVDPEQN